MIETADYDGIVILTLNNGPVNALDLELLTAVPERLAAVADSRAVVLTGSGRSFSAGVDLKRTVDGGLPYVEKFLSSLSLAMLTLFEHPKPVVAAVNGHALAGGCVLAAACDIRLGARGRRAGSTARRGAAASGRAVRRPTRRVRPREAPAPWARPRAH
jgi:enoyl-CoA hydratase